MGGTPRDVAPGTQSVGQPGTARSPYYTVRGTQSVVRSAYYAALAHSPAP